MQIAILGYGDQGQAAYEYWNRDGNELVIHDLTSQLEVPDGAQTRLGPDYLKDIGDYDLLVRSPSVHPKDIEKANPGRPDILKKITTVTDEFLQVCPSRNIVGVTGTKGKGTTSTLITNMLKSAGHHVHLGGNIGIPPLSLLKENISSDDWVVLELANFQLIDLKHSPHIAVCLMVAPEHLDWHFNVEEYVEAKQQLFRWQSPEDLAVFYGLNDYSQHIASVSPGKKIPYMKHPGADVIEGKIVIDGTEICEVSEIKLLGKHNWQNVCAAVTAVWQITQDVEAIRGAITSFTGLEHRLEFVRELENVKYYDDSFGTTPETAIVAIEAFDQPKVIILGGFDKGGQYKDLAKKVVDNNVRAVVIIGVTGPKIADDLREAGFTNMQEGGTAMADIVLAARNLAQLGDVVLLSTACASYDLFENYKDRGEQFKKVVRALA